VCCTACALNCQSCTSKGPGKCDTCNDGYHKTTGDVCSGKTSAVYLQFITVSVVDIINLFCMQINEMATPVDNAAMLLMHTVVPHFSTCTYSVTHTHM